MTKVTKATSVLLAQSLLDLTPEKAVIDLPDCTTTHHWALVRDHTITETWLDAVMTTTYPAAVACTECGYTIGIG